VLENYAALLRRTGRAAEADEHPAHALAIRLNIARHRVHTMDLLFGSMAREQGSGAVAVILTGMGADGAAGMKKVREAGGYTIAQDWATSVVYSKARFAVKLDAVCESLPLEQIAPRLLELVEPREAKRDAVDTDLSPGEGASEACR
jgi:chemotaxis response regulator CheB